MLVPRRFFVKLGLSSRGFDAVGIRSLEVFSVVEMESELSTLSFPLRAFVSLTFVTDTASEIHYNIITLNIKTK